MPTSYPAAPIQPWQQQPNEGAAAHRRFLTYLHAGPKRTLTATARAAGVSTPTIHEQARRYVWAERAAAFDAGPFAPVPARLEAAAASPPILAPVSDEERMREEEHEALLELFRSDVQGLGQQQLRLAKGLAAAAGRGLSELLKNDKPLGPREIAALAQAACVVGAAGQVHFGNAIGVHKLLGQMQTAVQDVEVVG